MTRMPPCPSVSTQLYVQMKRKEKKSFCIFACLALILAALKPLHCLYGIKSCPTCVNNIFLICCVYSEHVLLATVAGVVFCDLLRLALQCPCYEAKEMILLEKVDRSTN